MSKYRRPDAKTIQELKDIANKLRINSIRSTNAGKSGHPTSCCSAAEIVSVLFFHSMHYKVKEPRHPSNDRFVLSKGHAAPLLYSVWAEVGLFPTSDLLKLRSIDSDLEGHPTPRLNFIDVATGSLGQGLSCAAGMAFTGKYFDKASYRVYCMIGDGESAEGSIWEALAFSSHYKLDNLVAIFDINRLGQSEPTALQHDLDTYKRRVEAFGCNTYVIDGHNVEELCKVFHDASRVKGMPTCILARTFKGKGIVGIEDFDNWHGKILGDKADKAIDEITAIIHNQGKTNLSPPPPNDDAPPVNISNICLSESPNYKTGEKVATRFAYGTAVSKLGFNNPHVIALDGDTKNSTFSEKFKKDHPERFIEGFIAEQNIVGVAVGCGTRGRTVPFVSLFAAFFTRAFDQLRMAAISQANIKCVGSHVGVSIGEDGPSQMALEDLAMFRSIPSSVVFYPSDAVACERSCELAANIEGICYIRTSRPNTPVIYSNDEKFEIGKAKIVLESSSDKVTVIAAGITLHEALRAATELASAGINICIIDLFTVKPLDIKTILSCVKRTEGRVVTVEDHYPEGGIGESVSAALSSERNIFLKMLAVRSLPRSGPPEVLIDRFGIGSKTIIKTVQSILNC